MNRAASYKSFALYHKSIPLIASNRSPFVLLVFLSFLLIVYPSFVLLAQKKRLVVSKDGSGDYTTVQAAFDAVPMHNTKPVTIFIKKGTYKEKLRLDSPKHFVTVVGEDKT